MAQRLLQREMRRQCLSSLLRCHRSLVRPRHQQTASSLAVAPPAACRSIPAALFSTSAGQALAGSSPRQNSNKDKRERGRVAPKSKIALNKKAASLVSPEVVESVIAEALEIARKGQHENPGEQMMSYQPSEEHRELYRVTNAAIYDKMDGLAEARKKYSISNQTPQHKLYARALLAAAVSRPQSFYSEASELLGRLEEIEPEQLHSPSITTALTLAPIFINDAYRLPEESSQSDPYLGWDRNRLQDPECAKLSSMFETGKMQERSLDEEFINQILLSLTYRDPPRAVRVLLLTKRLGVQHLSSSYGRLCARAIAIDRPEVVIDFLQMMLSLGMSFPFCVLGSLLRALPSLGRQDLADSLLAEITEHNPSQESSVLLDVLAHAAYKGEYNTCKTIIKENFTSPSVDPHLVRTAHHYLMRSCTTKRERTLVAKEVLAFLSERSIKPLRESLVCALIWSSDDDKLRMVERTYRLLKAEGYELQEQEFGEILGNLITKGLKAWGLIRVLLLDMIECNYQVPLVYVTRISGLNNPMRFKMASQLVDLLGPRSQITPELAQILYGTIARFHCDCGRMEEAEAAISSIFSYGVSPLPRTIEGVIQTYYDQQNYEAVLNSFRRFQPPHKRHYFMIRLNSIIKAQDVYTALKYFRNGSNEEFRESWCYGALVRGLCEAGDLEGAEELYKEMRSCGLVPNARTVNSCIILCGKLGLKDKAIQFFTDMRESGVEPDNLTVSSLMHCWAAEGDIAGMEEVVNLMRKHRVMPSVVIYNAILRGFLTSHDFKAAFSLFEKVRHHRSPKLGWTMLAGLAKARRVDDAIRILRLMRKDGVNVHPNLYGLVVALLCYYKRLDEAMALKEWLDKEKVQPSALTYEHLVITNVQCQNTRTALSLFKEMKAAGYIPTQTLLVDLIAALDSSGQLDEALQLMKYMDSIKPKKTVLDKLFEADAEDPEEKETLAKDKEKEGEKHARSLQGR